MSDEPLMSIGTFAQHSGLSVPALRYYDEVELLTPAIVNPTTGYRRYLPDQLFTARQIYVLRSLELPVETVQAIAAGATEAQAPRDYDWMPRTSIVDDPSGNRIALHQA